MASLLIYIFFNFSVCIFIINKRSTIKEFNKKNYLFILNNIIDYKNLIN